MPMHRFLLLLAAALLYATAFRAPALATPARDWTQQVTVTPAGAYVIGNPAAKTRLVEYVSYTCPHCADFTAEATTPLKNGWIAKGALALEIRNLVRDRYDLTAAILARCGGTARFENLHQAIFANYDQWIGRVRDYDAAPSILPKDASRGKIMTDIADKTGLLTLMVQHNVSLKQSRACLADPRAIPVLLAMTKTAIEQDHVSGTPSFVINGTLTQAHDWMTLRPLLPASAN